ncbi:hypothetical protein EPO34_00500 [Patescibacteria group bacterium]|nr:MAG: hypothetical protein EPO34_00500 [Patescibacteria group bacterium]
MDWQKVLSDWQREEEEAWRPLYTECGFGSWLEWRKSYIDDLQLERRVWTETVIENPHDVVPAYAIGGYKGWKPYRPAGKDVATFADVAAPAAPGEVAFDGTPRLDVRTNRKVASLVGALHDFHIIVLRCGDLNVVLEGTHRCAATAVEAADGNRSRFRLTVRTAAFDSSERALLEEFCRERAAVIKK